MQIRLSFTENQSVCQENLQFPLHHSLKTTKFSYTLFYASVIRQRFFYTKGIKMLLIFTTCYIKEGYGSMKLSEK